MRRQYLCLCKVLPRTGSLHNQLLLALLHNASSSRPIHDTPTLNPSQARKRPRSESDLDDHEVFVRPKSRVQKWVLGMSKSARDTLKNELVGYDAEPESGGKQLSEMLRGWQGRRPKAAAGEWMRYQVKEISSLIRVKLQADISLEQLRI